MQVRITTEKQKENSRSVPASLSPRDILFLLMELKWSTQFSSAVSLLPTTTKLFWSQLFFVFANQDFFMCSWLLLRGRLSQGQTDTWDGTLHAFKTAMSSRLIQTPFETVPAKLPLEHRSVANSYLCHIMLQPAIWCVTAEKEREKERERKRERWI